MADSKLVGFVAFVSPDEQAMLDLLIDRFGEEFVHHWVIALGVDMLAESAGYEWGLAQFVALMRHSAPELPPGRSPS